MTSRDRIAKAFAHKEADTVPVDFGGHRSSGIAAIAYARLRRHLGLPAKPIRVYDPIQQLSIIDSDVLDLFGIDAIEMGRAFAQEDRWWQDWTLPDGTPCQMPSWVRLDRGDGEWIMRSLSGQRIARMPDGALYFEQTTFPYAESDQAPLPEAMEETMWTSGITAAPPGPIGGGPEGTKALRDGARALRSSTSRAIVGLFGGNLLEIGQFLYRNDNFFMLLAGEPERAEAFLDRLVEMHLSSLERFLSAVGDSIDIVLFGDDLGMQSGPQISPEMYRRIFKPRHARMWRRAKQLAPVKVMLHCCGGIRELLPDLIDAGLDTVNPVQVSCAGMEPAALKKDFGSDIVFWGGGCDTREVLPLGTPGEVRDHVRRQVDILARDGGFVFQQVHNILANVPPENIVAMFQAIRS
ncbi:MAG TPA: uroporphyrinogen decarboxylase family protein [Spirochaetia bacterium]|nr:uroporphyrinogen decarboxylase family protein [Spirochaetia bacterium]